MYAPLRNGTIALASALVLLTACGPERRDADNDGVSLRDGDCDDFDAAVGDQALDADCDGVLTDDDCDDNDPTSPAVFIDPECDGYFLADNGVTVRCPGAVLYTSGAVDGKTYVRRDRSYLKYSATAGDFASACTTGITDMSAMFERSNMNEDIGSWDTSNVIDMPFIFQGAESFNQDIGSWDTSNVTDMRYMFREAKSFNQDLSGWCVSKIRSTPSLFATGATSWTRPKPVWGTCP